MKQAFIDHECECILYYCILQIVSLVFELVYNMSKKSASSIRQNAIFKRYNLWQVLIFTVCTCCRSQSAATDATYVTLENKTSRRGMFVTIAKNTLYGSKI